MPRHGLTTDYSSNKDYLNLNELTIRKLNNVAVVSPPHLAVEKRSRSKIRDRCYLTLSTCTSTGFTQAIQSLR